MVQFSGVEMPITTPGDKAALALLAELDRRAQATAKNAGANASNAINTVQKHSANAARAIAGNVAMIAAQGEATAGSLKGILTQGANVAFMFGASGAIGGAIALTGLAMYNLFTRTRQQIEETAQKAREEMEKIARAGDLGGAATQAGILQSGDPFAAVFGKHKDETDRDFDKRRLGLTGVQNAIAEQQRRQAAAAALPYNVRQQAATAAYNEIARLRDLEKELTEEHARAVGVVMKLSAAEDERSRNALNRLRELSEKERGAVLAGLTFENRAPAPGLLGKPMSTFSFLDASDSMLKGIQERLKKAPQIPTTELTPELERILNLERVAEEVGDSFGSVLGQSITAGITAGINGGGIAGGFRAMAGVVLEGLGGMLERVGVAALAGMKFIAAIKDAITSFAPELGIPAAIGLIALGGILQASGAALGGGNRGGGGGGGSYYGGTGTTIVNRGLVNPLNGVVTSPGAITPRASVNLFATIIGTRDAKAQREIVEMVRLGLARSGG